MIALFTLVGRALRNLHAPNVTPVLCGRAYRAKCLHFPEHIHAVLDDVVARTTKSGAVSAKTNQLVSNDHCRCLITLVLRDFLL